VKKSHLQLATPSSWASLGSDYAIWPYTAGIWARSDGFAGGRTGTTSWAAVVAYKHNRV